MPQAGALEVVEWVGMHKESLLLGIVTQNYVDELERVVIRYRSKLKSLNFRW